MLVEAEIRIQYKSEKEARAVARAISPDNFKVPKGLTVNTIVNNRTVVTEVSCKRSLKTFGSTLDDLLQSIQAAEKAVGVVRKHE